MYLEGNIMYFLYAPMWDSDNKLKKLLKEVLGYNDNEIKILESEHFCRNVANNLTIEQAKEISDIFVSNDFQIYLNDGRGAEGVIAWRDLGIMLNKSYLKDHYCDEPLISKEQKANLSIPKIIKPAVYEKPAPKCPTCQSTNIKKIGELERTGSIAIFGLFSKKINKTFKCNNCGYTW
jgi:predicted nucleic-acid-binding Zn-ribbon protein